MLTQQLDKNDADMQAIAQENVKVTTYNNLLHHHLLFHHHLYRLLDTHIRTHESPTLIYIPFSHSHLYTILTLPSLPPNHQVTTHNDNLLDVNDALTAQVAALTQEKAALAAKLTDVIGVIAGLQSISLQ